jgi:hypothetical protein
MINYEDLKNGDLITFIDEYDEIRIVIVNKIEENSIIGKHMLYTYADLDVKNGDVFLEKYEPNSPYILENILIRYTNDEEKANLYDALYKEFTEEYDVTWQEHFTDSSYFDILDFLLYVFSIETDDDDLRYPDFINEIKLYIWDKCCAEMGCIETVDTMGSKIRNNLSPFCNTLCAIKNCKENNSENRINKDMLLEYLFKSYEDMFDSYKKLLNISYELDE